MKLLLNFIEQQYKQGNQDVFLLYNKPLTIEENFQILFRNPSIMLLCDFCERALNNAASILLIAQSHRDLCITCFLKNQHGSKFQYYIRPNLNVSITENQWSILSQLILLNAISKYGYGSWDYIKNYMDYHGHNFRSGEIKRHFDLFYKAQNYNIVCISISQIIKNYFSENYRKNKYFEEGPILQKPQPQQKISQEVSFMAYNPKRQQYLLDYDEQAENLICDLQFPPDDSPEQLELKLKMLEKYDYRVRERQKRQQFVLQHQLLSEEFYKKRLQEGKIKTAQRNSIRGFSRFVTYKQSQQLVSYLALQQTLKGVIGQLTNVGRKCQKPTFSKVYQLMEQKKWQRQLAKGSCPINLKKVFVNEPEQFFPKKRLRNAPTEIDLMQKIQQTGLIERDAKIAMISRSK